MTSQPAQPKINLTRRGIAAVSVTAVTGFILFLGLAEGLIESITL